MKVLQINSVCGVGSTGRIAANLYKILENQGHECKIAYGRGSAPDDINSIKKHLKSFVKCDVKRKNIYFDVEDEVDPTLRFIGDQKLLEEAIINMIKVSAEWTIQGYRKSRLSSQ